MVNAIIYKGMIQCQVNNKLQAHLKTLTKAADKFPNPNKYINIIINSGLTKH